MTRCLTIIAAGGNGQRVGGTIPKQYINLNDKPIVTHCIETFEKSSKIDGIIIVVASEYYEIMLRIIKQNSFKKIISVVEGGKTRQESVFNALELKECAQYDFILVHDAARPFVSLDIIDSVVNNIVETGCVVPVVAVKDTIKVIEKNGEVSTPNRSSLYAAQTPQGFYSEILLKAHKQAKNDGFEGYDDSVLTERIGVKTKLIEGSDSNIKITTKEDLNYAKKGE